MKITVLGGGGWGIAIANLLANKGNEVKIWEFQRSYAEELISKRESVSRLKGIPIDARVSIGWELEPQIQGSELLIMAVPSSAVRPVCQGLRNIPSVRGAKKMIVNLAKGIENGSLMRMSEIILEELPFLDPYQVAVLSGPSHAEEVARDIPTSVVMACKDEKSARRLQDVFFTENFRTYWNTDLVGVELSGAYKNVIAIASGIIDGIGLGDNTKGALLTRGLAEMSRLGENLGAQPSTFFGLSGLGDLVTTCISLHSRNRHVGEAVGRGEKIEEVLAKMTMVAEGVPTCRSIYSLAMREKVELPIAEQVYKVLFEGKAPIEGIRELMTRSLKPE